jgi:hypothetical protein
MLIQNSIIKITTYSSPDELCIGQIQALYKNQIKLKRGK